MPRYKRRRYIAVKIKFEKSGKRLSSGILWKVVFNSLLRLYGEYGASHAELNLIEYDCDRDYVIFRCNHKSLEAVRNSISTITEINGLNVALHVIYVSGTLRALKRKLKNYFLIKKI